MKVARTVFIALISIAFTSTDSLCSELAAKAAKGITVRIEGATQGSGVIVNQEGNTYTVLTAWHVLKSNQPGEEISIYTEDGLSHISTRNQSKQISGLDLGSTTFTSPKSYQIAEQGNIRQIKSGGDIFVAGFPLPSTAIPVSILRFLSGRVIANALGTKIPKGYELLYDNPTLPGMSGGAVLTKEGKLVGIHGQGETDSALSIQSGMAVKTGTNQAIPITYWKSNEKKITGAEGRGIDSLLAKIISLNKIPGPRTRGSGGFRHPFNGYETEIIKLTNQILEINPENYIAYNIRGSAKLRKPSKKGQVFAKLALEHSDGSYEPVLAAEADWLNESRSRKSIEYIENSHWQDGVKDLKKAESIRPWYEPVLINLANAYRIYGEKALANEYWNKLVDVDEKYLYNKYMFLVHSYPERFREGCQALFASASNGDERSIMDLSEAQTETYLTTAKCYEFDFDLDQDELLITLTRLNKKIKQWELEHGFENNYEAEAAFKTLDTLSSKNWKSKRFYKQGYAYIRSRFTRGALKNLIGFEKGMCQDLMSHVSWGSGYMWIKYMHGYVKKLCGATIYNEYRL